MNDPGINFDFGLSNLDLEHGVDASGLAKPKAFPVGAWELGLMAFVGGIALAMMTFKEKAK